MKVQEAVKEFRQTQQMEKAQKFMQDRNERMKRREEIRREHLDKNRKNVKAIKQAISQGIENNKQAEQHKISKVKARKVKEKLERSVSPLLSPHSPHETINDKLEKEYEESQANITLLQELKMKEKQLLAKLQATINNSIEIVEYAKAASSSKTYPRTVRGDVSTRSIIKTDITPVNGNIV